jgi:tRNA(fMet)-specific endonuclease VapC
LVDTNILGYFARNSSAALQKRMLAALKKQEVAISAITRAETRFGLALLQPNDKRRRTIDLLLNEIPVLPWTLEAADHYGEIAAHLQQTGPTLGDAQHTSLQSGDRLETRRLDDVKNAPFCSAFSIKWWT